MLYNSSKAQLRSKATSSSTANARGCCERDPSEETGAGARLDDPSEDSGRVRRAADGHDALQLDRRLARPVTWAAERAACGAAAAAADAQVEIRASGRRRLTERGDGRGARHARRQGHGQGPRRSG